jgi:hypothetical protein
MRKRKPIKPAPAPRRENARIDHTPATQFLETELARLIQKCASLPRAVVIRTLLEHADVLCQLAVEADEDLSCLEGLLS